MNVMNMTFSLRSLTVRMLSLTLFCLALCVGANAQYMEAKEYAAEIDEVQFGSAPTSNSLIFVKRCDQCSQRGVSFRPQTRFFDGRRSITAAQAELLTGRGATILFDPQTNVINRVIFWPIAE